MSRRKSWKSRCNFICLGGHFTLFPFGILLLSLNYIIKETKQQHKICRDERVHITLDIDNTKHAMSQ